MGLDEKIQAVLNLRESMQHNTGRNPVITDWFVPILAEVAEIPKYRPVVHDIRRIVLENTDTPPLKLARR